MHFGRPQSLSFHQFIAVHHTALHHKADSFKQRDVFERIAWDSDQIGMFAFLNAADAVAPADDKVSRLELAAIIYAIKVAT